MEGICNNDGQDCQGQYCANHGCDVNTGKCTVCSQGRYHGPHKACELKYCPKVAMKTPSDKIIIANSTAEEVCSCDPKKGQCQCSEQTWGPTCSFRMCPLVDAQNPEAKRFVR